MSTEDVHSPSDIDRRIRRTGKVGRFLCTTLLILGGLFGAWLTLTIAFHPSTLVKLNLDDKRTAQLATYKQDPARLLETLQAHPTEVMALAKAEKEANHYQDLADHRLKRLANVAFIAVAAALILAFVWLVRRLFAAFAEGEVITADNARILKRLGFIVVLCGILTLNLGVVLAGLLNIVFGWSLRQALLLKAEQALVI
jgi:hypothetical protein